MLDYNHHFAKFVIYFLFITHNAQTIRKYKSKSKKFLVLKEIADYQMNLCVNQKELGTIQ